MAVSDLFVSGLDAGDNTGCDRTKTLCKQRIDQWSIMYDLWCSNVKWNLDGYICLPASLVWGVLGTISMRWGNGLLIRLYGFLPEGIGHLLVWILAGMLVLDVTATIFALSGIGRSTQKWEAVDSWFTSISLRIGQWLYGHVDRRIHRAYPKTVQVEKPQRAAACRSWCGCSLSGVCLAISQRRSSAGSLQACG